MKNFQCTTFTNVFNRLIASKRGSPTATGWRIDEVAWKRERHAYSGSDHSFQIEVHRLEARSATPWTLFVVVERWWTEGQDGLIRSNNWVKLVAGKRTDALAWFARKARALD